MVTFIIIAVGIKGVSDDARVNDDPGEVLCTVFMGRVSQDGSAHVVGPAVPEWTQRYYKATSFDAVKSMFGFI